MLSRVVSTSTCNDLIRCASISVLHPCPLVSKCVTLRQFTMVQGCSHISSISDWLFERVLIVVNISLILCQRPECTRTVGQLPAIEAAWARLDVADKADDGKGYFLPQSCRGNQTPRHGLKGGDMINTPDT